MILTLDQFHQKTLQRIEQRAVVTLNLWSLRVQKKELPDCADYRIAAGTLALYKKTHPNVVAARIEYWIDELDSINQDAFQAFVDAYGTLRTMDVLPA